MTNKPGNAARLVVGEKTYWLTAGFSSVADLEDECERPISDILADIEHGNVRLSMLRAMLWAFAQRYHHDIDLLQAGAILDEAGAAPILAACVEALGLALNNRDAPKKRDWRQTRMDDAARSREAG